MNYNTLAPKRNDNKMYIIGVVVTIIIAIGIFMNMKKSTPTSLTPASTSLAPIPTQSTTSEIEASTEALTQLKDTFETAMLVEEFRSQHYYSNSFLVYF